MSVPVYQIMGKGCHRQDENMSFSPLFVKIFCRSSGSLANRHVDNFVHKLFTSLIIMLFTAWCLSLFFMQLKIKPSLIIEIMGFFLMWIDMNYFSP